MQLLLRRIYLIYTEQVLFHSKPLNSVGLISIALSNAVIASPDLFKIGTLLLLEFGIPANDTQPVILTSIKNDSTVIPKTLLNACHRLASSHLALFVFNLLNIDLNINGKK